jgi:O-6-methylguanine DNA methyltransferase
MIACSFSEDSQKKAETAVLATISRLDGPVQSRPSVTSTKFQELYDLYMGRRRADLSSIDLSYVSPFRREVYTLLCRIPRGRVTTYGTIAEKLESRQYARAVGTAVGGNPMPLVIPCHRVVLSTLKVGSYGMPGRKPSEGAYMKKRLLELEGVEFLNGKVSSEYLWFPK